MGVSYYVNIDYLQTLSGEKESSRINQEFEYVFLLLNGADTALASQCIYAKDYLDFLEQWKGPLPVITPLKTVSSDEIIPWWGKLKNINNEKKWNSKITATEYGKKYNLCPSEVVVIRNIRELQEHIEKYDDFDSWLIRHPMNMSGQGHFFFTATKYLDIKTKNILKNKLNLSPYILSPYFNRVLDLGLSFNVSAQSVDYEFATINFNTEKGSFRGGVLYDYLDPQVNRNYHQNIADIKLRLVNAMGSIPLEEIQQGRMQVDAFLYKRGEGIHSWPLVEINARKTMGDVIYGISKIYSDKIVHWVLVLNKDLKIKPDLYKKWVIILKHNFFNFFNFNLKKGIFPTSPIGLRFSSFAVIGDTVLEVQLLKEEIKKLRFDYMTSL